MWSQCIKNTNDIRKSRIGNASLLRKVNIQAPVNIYVQLLHDVQLKYYSTLLQKFHARV